MTCDGVPHMLKLSALRGVSGWVGLAELWTECKSASVYAQTWKLTHTRGLKTSFLVCQAVAAIPLEGSLATLTR